MSIPLSSEELKKLQDKIVGICNEAQEFGANSIIVAYTFYKKNDEGQLCINRAFRTHGNYYEIVGLVESVRTGLREEEGNATIEE